MKLLILSILFMLISATIWAQGSVRGTLRNRSNNQPLGEGKLTLVNTQKKKAKKLEISPNDNGTFIFTSVEPGLYDLIYTNEGYVSQRIVGLFIKDRGEKLAYLKIRPSNPANPIAEEVINTYAALQAAKETKVQTASFDADKLIDAPATVFLLSKEDIREQGLMTLADIFNVIPNMEVQEKNSYYTSNTYTIRGLESNKKFIIMLDGVRISAFTSAYNAMDKNISIANAKQVEILLGPASVLYGADAVTGVINIVSAKEENSGLLLSQSTGRFETQEYNLLGIFKNKKWSYLFSGYYYKSKEAKLPDFYPQDYSWYNQRYKITGELPLGGDTSTTQVFPIQEWRTNREAKALYFNMHNKNWELGAQFNSQKHSFNMGARDLFLSALNNFFANNSISLYGKHSTQINKLRFQSLLNILHSEVSPNSSYGDAYNHFQTVHLYGFESTAQFNEVATYQIDSSQQLQVGFNLNYTYTLPNNIQPLSQPVRRLNIHQQMQNQQYWGSATTWQDGRDTFLRRQYDFFSQLSTGLFIQYKIALAEKLFLNLGTRLDYVKTDIVNYSFNPRFGLVYKPSPRLTFKSFYGEAFLNPAIDANTADFVIISPILDSTGRASGYEIPYFGTSDELKPEKLRSIEASGSYNKNNLYIAANGYYSFLKNAIGFEQNINPTSILEGVPILYAESTRNNSSRVAYGGFLQAQYNLDFKQFKLKLGADYSYSNGYTQSNSADKFKLPYNAPHTIRLSSALNIGGFSIHLRALHRGQSYSVATLDETTGAPIYSIAPKFWQLTLNANYRIANDKNGWYVDIFARIHNLSNSRYYNLGVNYVDIMPLTPQDPLRWVVGARFCIAN